MTQGYGDIALERPGMQNIVDNKLATSGSAAGYPVINKTVASNLITTGYNGYPTVYQDAKYPADYWYGPWRNQPIYNYAGGKNVSDGTQQRAIQANGSGSIGNLTDAELSLSYLFNPRQANQGKRSYTNVTDLFQLDDKGYYYYDMRKNYAAFDEAQNKFVIYDMPAGVRTDGTNSIGNFFPFNPGTDAFGYDSTTGQVVNNMNANNVNNVNPVDHHLGMTMETNFRQPDKGKVGSGDMTFEFVGDDDIWVFVDDVLVLDMGGIHSEIYGTINFSTGEVNIGTAYNSNGEIFDANGNYNTPPKITSTIKDMFMSAGVTDASLFKGDTFASNTSHTLKMFYLERGNYDSSISIKFNLQPELYQQIKKVDQDGNPLNDVEFDLYEVSGLKSSADGKAIEDIEIDDVEYTPTPVTKLKTGEDGMAGIANFKDKDSGSVNEPYNFADNLDIVPGSDPNQPEYTIASRLYVLHETSAPSGYRMLPSDILLRYDPATGGTFVVNNRYETGSFASFNSYVTQLSPDELYFGKFDGATGEIISANTKIPRELQQNGLIVAVPTLKQGQPRSYRWDPVYGSNEDVLSTISYDISDENAMRHALLKAVLQQAYRHSVNQSSVPGWYLTWGNEGRLVSFTAGDKLVDCTLSDLPGNPSRYLLYNPDGDMQMVYGVISSDVFANLGNSTEKQRYEYLGNLVKQEIDKQLSAPDAIPDEQQINSAVEAVMSSYIHPATTPGVDGTEFATRGFSGIQSSGSQFERNFRSLINIPNEQRELRVWKLDQNGTRVNGAVFGLFNSKAEAEQAATAEQAADGVSFTIKNASGTVVPTLAAGVTGQLSETKYRGDDLAGMLIFAPYVAQGPGGANTTWIQGSNSSEGRVVYLKEITPPIGYESNNTIIPIVIGKYGIYADAGTKYDDVTVYAGVGKLNTTMTKYAASPDFNLTLRYITADAQIQGSDSVPDGASSVVFDDFNRGWTSTDKSMNLEYGVNALVSYGSSGGFTQEEMDNGIGYQPPEHGSAQRPLFSTSTGYIRTGITQNTEEMLKHMGDYTLGDVLRTPNSQGGYDYQSITNLFMIRNTVAIGDLRHQEPLLRKVDQNRAAVFNAGFEMYAVNAPAGTTDDNLSEVKLSQVSGQITAASKPIASIDTGSNGEGIFAAINKPSPSDPDTIDFAQRARDKGMNGGRLYVIRENKTPQGYRSLATDILMRFEMNTGQLAINNRFDTGACASFMSYVTVDRPIHYAQYENGVVSVPTPDLGTVDEATQKSGLVLPVPIINTNNRWLPLYGDIVNGYEAIDGTGMDSVLNASLTQALGCVDGSVKPWHLSWDANRGTLGGILDDLPGSPDRYKLKNSSGDMQMVYLCLSPRALAAAGVDTGGDVSTDEAYRRLGTVIKSRGVDVIGAAIRGVTDGVRFIDANDFNRNFQSVVYIPNEQRELRIWKVDEAHRRVDNVVFGLFDSRENAERATRADVSGGVVTALYDADGHLMDAGMYAAGVTGMPRTGNKDDNQPGSLVFAPYVEDGPGTSHVAWIDSRGNDLTGRVLYLKEIQAPAGYNINPTLIPVVIGKLGIYADSCEPDDGVDVLAGVGRLASPMKKFAASPYVDLTLRYITATAQIQPSLQFNSNGEVDDSRYNPATSSLDFNEWNADWRTDVLGSGTSSRDPDAVFTPTTEPKQMELEFDAPGTLVDYGLTRDITNEDLANGIGYPDAYGSYRPLLWVTKGFVRTSVEQDTALMEQMRSPGAVYAGVDADDLTGRDLTPLFSLRNTVRVVDTGEPIEPPEPPDYDPDDPSGYDPDNPSGRLSDTGDQQSVILGVLALIAISMLALQIGMRYLRRD